MHDRLLIVRILVIISTLPLYAQGRQLDAAKLKADTERVVSSILGDQAKMTAYCEINRLSEQAGEADQQTDSETSKALSQKVIELEKTLGPEYVALVNGLKDVDPDSPEGAEINSILESLDDSCPDYQQMYKQVSPTKRREETRQTARGRPVACRALFLPYRQ